jgi:hypothetical protein
MSFDVFISYASKDKAIADATCAALESAQVRCWIAPRDVLPGADWSASIIDALDNCRAMVLIFSAKANDSPQIRNEVARAVQLGVPVIPVRIEDIPPAKSLAYFIGAVHWLDAVTPPIETHLKRLAENVKALLQAASAAAARDLSSAPAPLSANIAAPAPTRRINFPAVAGIGAVVALSLAAFLFLRPASDRFFAPKPPMAPAAVAKPEAQPVVAVAPPPVSDQMLARYAITVPGISLEVRERNAREYAAEKGHKAQAVSLSPPGLYRSGNRQCAEIAEEAALENCQIYHGNPCALVAVNETLLPVPSNGEWPRRDMPRVRYAGNFDPNQMPAVAHLRQRSDIAGYAAAAGPKAIAYGPPSRVMIETAAPSQREAEERALNACNADLSRNNLPGQCYLYAVGKPGRAAAAAQETDVVGHGPTRRSRLHSPPVNCRRRRRSGRTAPRTSGVRR